MPENKLIDIDYILKSKNAALHKLLPRFIISYLKRISHQDSINTFIENNKNYYDYDFARQILTHFGVHVKITNHENLNKANRPIIASNHPLGGLDGMALMADLGETFKPKALANDLLMSLDNLKNVFIPINKHGKNARAYITIINEAFDSDGAIILFPAGLVSRKKKGVIKDLEWKKTLIQRARKHKRDIVPTYIEGKNTDFFYNLANIRKLLGIKINIEMLYLADEMYKQRNSNIGITYGLPISYTVFDDRMNDEQWTEAIKTHVYTLKENPDAIFSPNVDYKAAIQ